MLFLYNEMEKKMNNIMKDLLELVSVRSDSGTVLECVCADKIYEMILRDPYFREHPEMCGKYDENDMFGRPVVWALKKGESRRTVVVSGHYDAVETTCYGDFEEFALDPARLKSEMLKSGRFTGDVLDDLNNENWMFGRGAADMKAGVAMNLQMLREFEPVEKNLLFTAVCDEENLSAGARQAVNLYGDLKEKYDLEYVYGVITEPLNLRGVGKDDPVYLLDGTGGKILPVAVVKGRLAHSAYVMNGLNSALILAEIIRNVDLSTDFLSPDLGICNQPPATQIFSDLKKTYDVSIPEYSAAGFNMVYFAGDQPMDLINRLVGVCKAACDTVVERFNKVYDSMVKAGQLHASFWVDNKPFVMTLSQLKEMLKDRDGFTEYDKKAAETARRRVFSKEMTMQKAGIEYIQKLMDFAGFTQPGVVVGVVPPFYPTVNNERMVKNLHPLHETCAKNLKEQGINLGFRSYSQGITDISYMSCKNVDSALGVMDNMAIPSDVYGIDFETLSRMNIPCQLVGPACRHIHQITERVYVPDVEVTIPAVLRELIKQA